MNVVMLAGIATLVAVDHSQARAQRLADRRTALREEAELLIPILEELRPQGMEEVQRYLDAACGRMQDTTSPGHHIAVALGADFVQARSHGRSSPEILQAMRAAAAAPNATARLGDETLLVGAAFGVGDTRVLVAESVSDALRAVRDQLLRRSVLLAGLGIVVAGLVDLVLIRLIIRPISALVGAVHRIGRGSFGDRVPQLGSTEFQRLAEEVNAMAAALAAAEAGRQRESDKARRIQAKLHGVTQRPPGWNVATIYRPASGVGGDYLDLRVLENGTVLACAADVSGHGVPAALGAAVLRALFDSAVQRTSDPAEILSLVNAQFHGMTLAEDFATMIVVALDSRAGRLSYASAGHEPCYLLRHAGVTRVLSATGGPLGIDRQDEWLTAHESIAPTDRLALLTDGWAEAASRDGTYLGRARLRQIVEQAAGLPPEAAAADVLEQVARWRSKHGRAADDLSLLLIEFSPSVDASPALAPCGGEPLAHA